jgi:hypothetical protein
MKRRRISVEWYIHLLGHRWHSGRMRMLLVCSNHRRSGRPKLTRQDDG